MSPGRLVALIIGACVLAVVLVHLAVAYYFMRAKFQLQEVEFSDEAPAVVPADATVEPAGSDNPAR
jgi:hypothetical protein